MLLLLLLMPGAAQDRRKLEKKRDALDKQIRTTNTLLEQARKEQQSAERQLQLLDQQLRTRQELIATLGGEVREADQRIAEDESVVKALEEDLEVLSDEYGRMLHYAYRNRSAYDRLSYLFAAESFQQAWKRSRYLDQLAEHRRRQVEQITATQTDLAARIAALRERRNEKTALLSEQQQERARLDRDKDGREVTLAQLRKEESRLRSTLRKQEGQRRDLDAAIRKAIEAELKPKTGGSSGKGGKLDLTLTPEARELNADFEKNKGRLPWPVAKGVITSRFGKQPHPVLKGIVIENNGIDITTEKGASVRALFRGEVSSVIVIPGAGKAVIVTHGAYRTVYSNLREVSVAKGQKVDTKQTLGSVLSEEGTAVAHVEIWKVTADGLVKVDPSPWLAQP
ncbi:MAG: peptidoglycan DD-metalloendopeptidase family protein [Flavobacteriales bacterium]|nr:peptidoglycan DD-metalloendopeptidase family protein [Flavobacteriales bacterium]